VKRMTKVIVGAGAAAFVATAALAGAAVASSTDDDGGDRPISGDAFDRASTAALAFTGGGRVTGTEVGDEESYYEVEVTMGDGRQIDVQLDERFAVASSKTDQEDGQD
jgi:hypothetical protein